MLSPEEVLNALDLAKKALPALDALHTGLDSLADHEKEDIRTAAVAVGQTIYDLKEGLTALESAVQAAVKA